MNERERWIVYPLLFLALGVALRDKMFKITTSQRVQTESLLVMGTNGQPLAVLGNARFDRHATGGLDILDVDVVRAKTIEAGSINAAAVQVGGRIAVGGTIEAEHFSMRIGKLLFDMMPWLGSDEAPRSMTLPRRPAVQNPPAAAPGDAPTAAASSDEAVAPDAAPANPASTDAPPTAPDEGAPAVPDKQ